MLPTRFGIIGCSSVARRRFLPAVCSSTLGRVERIGSRDPGKGEQFAKEFNCAKWGSYENVVEDPEVDAVYISTPPALHEHWARAAAERGKHILCEKPAFLSAKAAGEIVDLCRRKHVRLMEGYMFRYHPQHKVVQTLIDNGRIGEPRAFYGEFALPIPTEGNFRTNPELGGGVFWDAAGYPVSAATLFFKAAPVSVFCEIEEDPATATSHLVSMMLRFQGNRTAHVTAVYGLHYTSRYSLLGPQGRVETSRAYSVPPEMPVELLIETGSGRETISVSPADQFRLMLEDFCCEINRGADSQNVRFEEDLLRQHRIMDAAWQSHLQKKPVFLGS